MKKKEESTNPLPFIKRPYKNTHLPKTGGWVKKFSHVNNQGFVSTSSLAIKIDAESYDTHRSHQKWYNDTGIE